MLAQWRNADALIYGACVRECESESVFSRVFAGENPQDGGFQQQQTIHGDVLPEL